ncbi:ORF66R [Turbot reddish body iridovirus]|uniref:ORF66R n=1 Tax=Turbot reddish body iridovirus TaxID=273651 RepID=E2CU11_ISKNV|nr:ORF66R [Turbot reddish body iridovirus]
MYHKMGWSIEMSLHLCSSDGGHSVHHFRDYVKYGWVADMTLEQCPEQYMVYVINGEAGKDNVFTFFAPSGGRLAMHTIASDYDETHGMMCVPCHATLLRVHAGCFNASSVTAYFNREGEREEDILWTAALLAASRNTVEFMDI